MSLSDLLVKKVRASPRDIEKTVGDIIDKEENAKGSAKIGNDFEKELEITLEVYEQLGLAYIQKFFPKSIWCQDKRMPDGSIRKGFMIYTAKAGFDYIGGTIITNTPIMIEAKSTFESRIDVYHPKHGIKQHQLERMLWLEQNTKFIVFYLWQVRKLSGVVYKFTPTQLLDAIGDKKSLTVADAEDARLPRMVKREYKGRLLYDFLYLLED